LTLRDNNHLETPKRQYENQSAPDPGAMARSRQMSKSRKYWQVIISSDRTLHSLRCSIGLGPA